MAADAAEKETTSVPPGRVRLHGTFHGFVRTTSAILDVCIPIEHEVPYICLAPALQAFLQAANDAEADATTTHDGMGEGRIKPATLWQDLLTLFASEASCNDERTQDIVRMASLGKFSGDSSTDKDRLKQVQEQAAALGRRAGREVLLKDVAHENDQLREEVDNFKERLEGQDGADSTSEVPRLGYDAGCQADFADQNCLYMVDGQLSVNVQTESQLPEAELPLQGKELHATSASLAGHLAVAGANSPAPCATAEQAGTAPLPREDALPEPAALQHPGGDKATPVERPSVGPGPPAHAELPSDARPRHPGTLPRVPGAMAPALPQREQSEFLAPQQLPPAGSHGLRCSAAPLLTGTPSNSSTPSHSVVPMRLDMTPRLRSTDAVLVADLQELERWAQQLRALKVAA